MTLKNNWTPTYFENIFRTLILSLKISQELPKSWTRLEEGHVNFHSSTSRLITN